MATSIYQRPFGFGLGTAVNAAIINNGAGKAEVLSTAHGLQNGSLIYLQTNIDSYNIFGFVAAAAADAFLIIPFFSGGADLVWIQDCPIVYYPSTPTGSPVLAEHFIGQTNWSCVHLPMVYQIYCSLGPNNLLDANRTVSSYSNDAGYMRIVLSGALAATVNDLDYIKITVATSPGIDGVYQIMNANSTSDLTINLPFDNIVFGSGVVQRYYNNYHIIVDVYAGLNSSHWWALQKPYELAGTLRLFPEERTDISDGQSNWVQFSVNELLKGYVKTKNNLLLGTLPNDIDCFVQYYISVSESYDVGTGYSFINFESARKSDQANFEGYAVNSKLPFKNTHSGYMTEYLMSYSYAGKFLTLFTTPTLFAGNFYDISFILTAELLATGTITLVKNLYLNSVFQSSITDTIPLFSEGVYRWPISRTGTEDRIDFALVLSQSIINPGFTGSLSPWASLSTGSFFHWTYGGNAAIVSFVTGGVSGTSDDLSQSIKPIINVSYAFQFHLTVAGYVSGNVQIRLKFTDNAAIVYTTSNVITFTANGSYSGQLTLTETSAADIALITKVGIYVNITAPSSGTGPIVTVDDMTLTPTSLVVSEVKTVNVNSDCTQQSIYLTWKNYLGEMDYWLFTTLKDYMIDISETQETKENIFPDWPLSYDPNADTIKKETKRVSSKQIVIHSQNVEQSDLDGIQFIKTSPLVQIMVSRSDRRTVIIDKNSFKVYSDGDKLHTIELTLTYTDEIPSQIV